MPRRSHAIATSKWMCITTSLVVFAIDFLRIVAYGNGSAPDERWQMLRV
jgi:hypothetical protein